MTVMLTDNDDNDDDSSIGILLLLNIVFSIMKTFAVVVPCLTCCHTCDSLCECHLCDIVAVR